MAMTEAEWLSADLFTLLGQVRGEFSRHQVPGRASERKLRLFACACCYRIRRLMTDDRCREAVAAGERYADGRATVGERDRACRAADHANLEAAQRWDEDSQISTDPAYFATLAAFRAAAEADTQWDEYTPYVPDADEVAEHCVRAVTLAEGVDAGKAEADAQRGLFHDIIANPFRPVTFDRSLLPNEVIQVARTIYITRSFERTSELAEALEDAGIADITILNHLRTSGIHGRGCWAVDLVLGRQ